MKAKKGAQNGGHGRGRGRAPRDIDLRAIRAEAALGIWKARTIGRILGIPGSTLLGPKHKDAVLEAIEEGRAEFERHALEQYEQALTKGNGNIISALIFKMKQLGWSDKVQHSGPGEGAIHLELEGATERFVAQLEKFMAKQKAEATQ